jgi:hypothetical protein
MSTQAVLVAAGAPTMRWPVAAAPLTGGGVPVMVSFTPAPAPQAQQAAAPSSREPSADAASADEVDSPQEVDGDGSGGTGGTGAAGSSGPLYMGYFYFAAGPTVAQPGSSGGGAQRQVRQEQQQGHPGQQQRQRDRSDMQGSTPARLEERPSAC